VVRLAATLGKRRLRTAPEYREEMAELRSQISQLEETNAELETSSITSPISSRPQEEEEEDGENSEDENRPLGLDAYIYVAHAIRRSKVTSANRNAYSERATAGTGAWERLSLAQFGRQDHIHLIQPDIPRDQPDI
jgi:hypothetical protein